MSALTCMVYSLGLRAAQTGNKVHYVVRCAAASRCKGGTCEGPVACWPLAQLPLVRSAAVCRVCSGDFWTAHIQGEGADVEAETSMVSLMMSEQPTCWVRVQTLRLRPAWCLW